jgi:hypothetical protein
MDVDESDTDSSECSEFIEDGERMEEDEISDSEYCGAEVSFVSNGSTLIAQSPARDSLPKICSRCKGVERTRKKGGVVVFDLNPKTGNTYAHCRSCKAYVNEISNPKNNPKNNLKVSYIQAKSPMKYPYN